MPSKIQVNNLLNCRLGFSNTLFCSHGNCSSIPILNQHNAIHTDILLASDIVLGHIDFQHTKILFSAQKCQCLRRIGWSHHNFKENRLEKFGSSKVNLTISGDNATENASLVSFISFLPSIKDIFANGTSARVHMLDPHAERLIEFPNDIKGRICILYIVVRQFLAIKLLCSSQ